MNQEQPEPSVEDLNRLARVTRDVVFFFHEQSKYDGLMDDLNYAYYEEEYWTALVDLKDQLDPEIQRGCLALIWAIGMVHAGNITRWLNDDTLAKCIDALKRYTPEQQDLNALKESALQALRLAAVPNEKRDFNSVVDLLGEAKWIHQLTVRPYFASRSRWDEGLLKTK